MSDRSRRRRRVILRRYGLVAPLTAVSSTIHRRHDLAASVQIFGSHRSGTTWVQEVLASGPRPCPIFEPFQQRPAIERCGIGPDPAVPPTGSAPELVAYLTEVMRGGALTPRALRLSTVPAVLRARRFVVKHV